MSFTLGARDFSSAVSGFCQFFIVIAARGFGLRPKMCRPSFNTENSRRTREKPLVPRVCVILSFFFWRTVHSKPPTITFVIVACTFFDNLSWNSYCIHECDFISLQSCKIVRLLYLVRYAKRGVLRTNAKVKVLLLIATEQEKPASKANETNEKRTRRSHFHGQKKKTSTNLNKHTTDAKTTGETSQRERRQIR